MSQHEYALHLEELRDHNEELQLQIEELKTRLSQYEEVGEESSTRSQESDVSEWSDWPYCWFVNGWNRTTQRFHSFHATLRNENLARQNVRAQRCYEKQNGFDDGELTLL